MSFNEFDERHILLETYGEIHNNIINFIDFNEFVEKISEEEQLNIIKNIYFPFFKRKSLFDDYKDILTNNANELLNLKKHIFLDDKNVLLDCNLKNVCMELKQINLVPKQLFSIIKASEEIPFIKYKNSKKKNF